MNSKSQNEPFFIIGCQRSGTTMLRLMLNEHPCLVVPNESFFISNLMDSLPLNSPLNEDNKRLAFNLISEHERWKRPEFKSSSNDKLWEVISSLEKPLLGELIDAVFRYCVNPKNKPRWGDKTPHYIKEMQRLHEVFPKAKFIHIIRDGRDVCISIRNVYLRNPNWKIGQTIAQAAKHWCKNVDAGIDSGKQLGSELYLEIRYEDLVQKTEEILQQICSFLGEKYNDKMLNFYEGASAEVYQDDPARFKFYRPPQSSDIYRWRTEMSLMDVAVVEAFAGNTMDRVGQTRYFQGALRLIPYTIRSFSKFRRIFTPTSQDREFLKLPNYAYFLYYLLRPIRLLGKYTLIAWKTLLPI